MVQEHLMWETHWGKGAFHFQEHRALLNACRSLYKDDLNGLKILEVGSGRGIDSVRFAQLGAKVVMLDYSPASFEISADLAKKAGVESGCVLCDAGALPFKNGVFDLVFSQGLLEHQENTTMLSEQVRVVSTGGHVIVDVPQLYSLQYVAKAIQIKMGRWPYGEEESFSFSRAASLLRQYGLQVVGAYGWEILPTLHLGLRNMFRRSLKELNGNQNGSSSLPELNLRMNFRDRFEQSSLGPRFMNNVGVIGRKIKD